MLDACVLVPAALRDTLLRAAVHGFYRPLWTIEILDELHRTLIVDEFTDLARADRLVATLRSAFPGTLLTKGYRELIPAMLNDPKDRHVVAAAVFANADLIVTSNLRHFPPAALAPFQIEVQSPDEFLVELFQAEWDVACEIVIAQASALRRPKLAVEDVLRNLALNAPEFAALVRQRLAESS